MLALDNLLLEKIENKNSPPSLIVCEINEADRPLKGLAGLLDWRLRGFLTQFLIAKKIHGSLGELVYAPVIHHKALHHVLLIGLGQHSTDLGLASKQVNDLQNKVLLALSKLKFKKVVLSKDGLLKLEKNQTFQVEYI